MNIFSNIYSNFSLQISAAQSTEADNITNLLKRKEDVINDLEKSHSEKIQIQENIDHLKESIEKLKLEQNELTEALNNLDSEEVNSEYV